MGTQVSRATIKQSVLTLKCAVLNAVGFRLNLPNAHITLENLCFIHKVEQRSRLYDLARYFLEVTVSPMVFLQRSQHVKAVTALYLAFVAGLYLKDSEGRPSWYCHIEQDEHGNVTSMRGNTEEDEECMGEMWSLEGEVSTQVLAQIVNHIPRNQTHGHVLPHRNSIDHARIEGEHFSESVYTVLAARSRIDGAAALKFKGIIEK